MVYGTKADIDEIGRMVESLDQPLPLARIDTIFVMVDLTEQNQRGIDALLGGMEWSKYSRGEKGDGMFGEVATTEQTVTLPGGETVTGSVPVERNTFQGVLGIPGLNSVVPFQLEDWKLSGVRWDQIFALSSERNDVCIFSTPSLMVSHNAPEVHILIEDERNIVIPTYYGNTSTDGTSSTGNAEKITAKTLWKLKSRKLDFLKLMRMELLFQRAQFLWKSK